MFEVPLFSTKEPFILQLNIMQQRQQQHVLGVWLSSKIKYDCLVRLDISATVVWHCLFLYVVKKMTLHRQFVWKNSNIERRPSEHEQWWKKKNRIANIIYTCIFVLFCCECTSLSIISRLFFASLAIRFLQKKEFKSSQSFIKEYTQFYLQFSMKRKSHFVSNPIDTIISIQSSDNDAFS